MTFNYKNIEFRSGDKVTKYTSTNRRYTETRTEIWMDGRCIIGWSTSFEMVKRMMKRMDKLDKVSFDRITELANEQNKRYEDQAV